MLCYKYDDGVMMTSSFYHQYGQNPFILMYEPILCITAMWRLRASFSPKCQELYTSRHPLSPFLELNQHIENWNGYSNSALKQVWVYLLLIYVLIGIGFPYS